MVFLVQFLSHNNLRPEQHSIKDIIDTGKWAGRFNAMLLKVLKQPFRPYVTDHGHGNVIRRPLIHRLTGSLIQTAVGCRLIKRVNIHMVLRRPVFHDIMAMEQFSDLIDHPDIRVFLNYQKVDLQRLRIQVIFLFINKVIPVFLKFQIHRRHKAGMPLYFLITH